MVITTLKSKLIQHWASHKQIVNLARNHATFDHRKRNALRGHEREFDQHPDLLSWSITCKAAKALRRLHFARVEKRAIKVGKDTLSPHDSCAGAVTQGREFGSAVPDNRNLGFGELVRVNGGLPTIATRRALDLRKTRTKALEVVRLIIRSLTTLCHLRILGARWARPNNFHFVINNVTSLNQGRSTVRR